MPRRPASPSLWTDRPDDWPEAETGPGPGPADDPIATRPHPRTRGARRSGPAASRRAAAVIAGTALVAAAAATTITLLGGDSAARDDRAAAPTTSTVAPLTSTPGTVAASPARSLYARASGAVVSVRVTGGGRTGSGTGFVIDDDGTIVTNAHVVGDATSAQVRVDDDRATVEARVRGTDSSTDLAVLVVDRSAVAGITPLTLADSDAVEVGDNALAIGYPLGLDRTATSGIVSGTGRSIEAPNGFTIDEAIQTDAPINPGNSGGPLLDAAGRVIGVNSQIATAGGGGGNVGIGFAVPSNTVREVVPRLLAGEAITRPYLGVSTSDTAGGQGAAVASLVAGGPADRAGLRVGDEIVRVDGQVVTGADGVAAAIADDAPGDRVDVEVRRGGATETLTVTLGTRPDATP